MFDRAMFYVNSGVLSRLIMVVWEVGLAEHSHLSGNGGWETPTTPFMSRN